MAETYANAAASTLNGAITNVATTLTVAAGEGARFPATGDFRLICESELMLCTSRATDVLTVTRGVEGTTAAVHANALAVTHVLTSAALQALPGVTGAFNVAGAVTATAFVGPLSFVSVEKWGSD